MNKKNKKTLLLRILIIIITVNFTSCNIGTDILKPKEKQWVYLELNTISKTDTTDYFYYGQMNKSIINKIDENENTNGLFILSNIRFSNDDKLLELYDNELVEGKLIFRIEDIEEITFYKDDPINLFELNELHESSKKIRNKSR